MNYYFMANIQIKDETGYQKYLDRAEAVFEKYSGSYLAVDEQPVLIEGTWKPGRAVLISFKSEEDFEAWYHSDAYQEILQYRIHASESSAILIRGKEELT